MDGHFPLFLIKRQGGCLKCLHWIGALLFVLILGQRLPAAAPLADYLSDDVALVVQTSGVRLSWRTIENSSLYKNWRLTPHHQLLQQSAPWQRWKHLDEKVQRESGLSFTEHLFALCDQEVTLALWMPAGADPQALLITRGESSQAVEKTVATWNRLEASAEITPRDVGGVQYFERRGRGQSSPVFYAVAHDVFLLSDQEMLVQTTLQRLVMATPQNSVLSQSRPYQTAMSRPVSAGSLVIYAAARRWDQAIQKISDDSPLSRFLQAHWAGTESVTAIFRAAETGLFAEVRSQFVPDQVTPAWRSFSTPADSATEVLSLSALKEMPADAWLVMGGQVAPEGIIAVLHSLMSEKDQREWDQAMLVAKSLLLQADPWRDAGRLLLQDWSVSLLQRSPSLQKPLRSHPFAMVWTSHWSPHKSNIPILQGLENGIGFLMNLAMAALHLTQPEATFDYQKEGIGLPSTWKLSGMPAGELGVHLSETGLVVTTSLPELSSPTTSDSADFRNSRLTEARDQLFPQAQLFAWINLAFVRDSEGLHWLLDQAKVKPSLHKTARLLAFLSNLLDETFLAITWSPEHVTWQFGALARSTE